MLFAAIVFIGCDKEEYKFSEEYDYSADINKNVTTYTIEPENLENFCNLSPIGRNDGKGGTRIDINDRERKFPMMKYGKINDGENIIIDRPELMLLNSNYKIGRAHV